MTMPRYLRGPIRADLTDRMVFLAGPRQVGKTTLARQLLAEWDAGAYFNWDNREDRGDIRAARWPGGKPLVVLDEIHKWRAWKSWIKGEFDKHRDRIRFLITGSARMDIYRRGGDSLQGRYHHYRLHPFSYAEVLSPSAQRVLVPGQELEIPSRGSQDTVAAFMQFGGFPEPLLAQSARTQRRWQKERFDRFFREDVRDLETIRDLSSIELLADMLSERIASPLSLNSLREDLEASHRAVTSWMEVLDRLYYVFRVRPYASTAVKSLHKMPKTYLWDSSSVAAPGPRFENLVASHLLKFCHYLQDREGFRADLHYLRDRAGREVDFLVTVDRKPWFAVEAKVQATEIDPAIIYFRERLRIPYSYQAVLESNRDYLQEGVRCLPARQFLAALV